MSFTDQQPRIATEEDCKASWSGHKNGAHFRCYLCGHKFQVGDQWRWINANSRSFVSPKDGKTYGLPNLLVCDSCDDAEGPQDNDRILNEWVDAHIELNERFWWAVED